MSEELGSFEIKLPLYRCPFHGDVNDTVRSRLDGKSVYICMHCIIDWAIKKFGTIEEIKR